MAHDITEARLLAAIEEAVGRVAGDPSEWRTTREWAIFWDCSEHKADLLLQAAFRAGILEHSKQPRLARDGMERRISTYRIVVKNAESHP